MPILSPPACRCAVVFEPDLGHLRSWEVSLSLEVHHGAPRPSCPAEAAGLRRWLCDLGWFEQTSPSSKRQLTCRVTAQGLARGQAEKTEVQRFCHKVGGKANIFFCLKPLLHQTICIPHPVSISQPPVSPSWFINGTWKTP